MKFFHLSDLHLGKRVNEFSMLDDQRYILAEIVRLAEENKPDAVLIAGDLYDKSVPSVEAVQLLDQFLVRLHELGIAVFIIAGNHDSVERIAFAASLLHPSGVHIAQGYNGSLVPMTLNDEHGSLNIWMLPYLKPALVRPFFRDNESEINTYTEALAAVLGNIAIDSSSRNILLTHQFVTGAIRSESEELSVGGSDNVDATLFAAFDYVALGHLHRPQQIGKSLRYCGSPLKYSFSEMGDTKSITVVEIGVKGDMQITQIPLTPRHEMREIRGSYLEVTSQKNYRDTVTDDYLRIVLTDEEDEPDAVMKLRSIYPNLMRLEYDNQRTQAGFLMDRTLEMEQKSPLELFEDLYQLQNGQPMSPTQEAYLRELFTKIWRTSL